MIFLFIDDLCSDLEFSADTVYQTCDASRYPRLLTGSESDSLVYSLLHIFPWNHCGLHFNQQFVNTLGGSYCCSHWSPCHVPIQSVSTLPHGNWTPSNYEEVLAKNERKFLRSEKQAVPYLFTATSNSRKRLRRWESQLVCLKLYASAWQCLSSPKASIP